MIDVIALVAIFVAGTWVLGWWSIPLFALVWGYRVGPNRWPALRAAIAAAAAWCGLLMYDHVKGPAWHLAITLGAVMHLPPIVLLGVTVTFAIVLAWSAATVGAATAPESRAQRS